MSECSADSLIIIDEVHGIGSSYQRLALDDSLYDYKLGLSATPERWFDDDGNEAINDFFGDVVYKFTLSDALIRTNPDTGKTFLTPYEYDRIIPLY
jgi:superfamily II DNA or RNA helicase